MSATEYFEQARTSVRAKRRLEQRLRVLVESEGVKAQSYTVSVHSSGVSDPMRRTDARMDFEPAAMAEIRAHDEEIDAARAVLERFRRAEPEQVEGAVAVEFRYLLDLSWREVAMRLGVSKRTAQWDAAECLHTTDDYGIARLQHGWQQ